MQDILINFRTDSKCCRFSSLQDLIDLFVDRKVDYNIKFALQEVVQCNVEYRNYLREYGYQATIEKLKREAPYIEQNPDVLECLDRWWSRVEEKGGLGEYNIQCLELKDTFSLFGEKISGLKGLQNIVQVSASEYVLSEGRNEHEEVSESSFVDIRKKKGSSLFVAKLWERYPIFDSSDALCEDRTYQCYFVKNHIINGSLFDSVSKYRLQDPISETILSSELPLIYYDGDSPVMFLISPLV